MGLRVFATCNIGDAALDILRQRGYELEVYPEPEPPPKKLILEKVRDEWRLVTMAWNMKRMFALAGAN